MSEDLDMDEEYKEAIAKWAKAIRDKVILHDVIDEGCVGESEAHSYTHDPKRCRQCKEG